MSWPCVGAQVKDGSHVVIWTACKRTHNQYETSCGFRPHQRECLYASGSIRILGIGHDYQYHTYKLYEQLILNRITPTIEKHLIREQAGFRHGKSCTSQLLNLTQHIADDGYQVGKITGTAFMDLSAAYDTVNHRLLIQKLCNTTQDSKLCRVIQNLLSNRRFYVVLNNELNRVRKQKNGLPQGNVLAPSLLNIYTNGQLIHNGTSSFI